MVLDGSLDEPAWQQAPISLGFVQKDPQEGEHSTERTEFRIVYTATTLYIGVVCDDSSAEGIVATERRRDSGLESDDTLTIVIDTFHDHRNAFLFRTNPLGAQYDARITDEGSNVNENWDEKWDVVSQISPTGWTAEFAIPFKSLRVSEQNGQGWGLDLERVIRRKNEFSYWNGFRRGFQLTNISQAGHLEGLENIETGLRLRVKPFTVAGFRQVSDGSQSAFRNASDIGIEVMKYRITPSLTADITWNTDFAQTEVDDQQVNLGRFPLFFPEKREFFQEGAGVYEIGAAASRQFFRPRMKVFHSRNIGLSPKRRIVPITAGARITGRLRGFTLGMLNVQTEELVEEFNEQTGEQEEENIPASNYSVLRVKRDVLSRSTVGGFFLNREIAGSSDFNRVYGVDANFVFYQHFAVGGLLGKSSSPGIKVDNWVSSGEVGWDNDFLTLGTAWVVVDPDFRNDMGFVPRRNVRQFSPELSVRPRPNSRLVRQLVFEFRSNYSLTQKNVLETKRNAYAFEIHFQDGGVFGWVPHTHLDRPPEPFEIRSGIVIPPGLYSWWSNVFRYRSNPAKRFWGSFRWQQHFDYYGSGSLHSLNLQGSLRLSEQFSVEPDYKVNKAALPAGTYMDEPGNFPDQEGTFTDHVVNARVNYNFNNKWLTSTIIQYNSTDSFWGFNFRLNYIFRPGDDLFLVYNEGRRAVFDDEGHRITGVFDGRKDRSLQLKLTYSFDY
ncbi:MAG: DUF5916 domain-containing protein [Acidobacteria bacterium]|nr:DUF5916 domain-containing protein [Acidobacteriota bacterium]